MELLVVGVSADQKPLVVGAVAEDVVNDLARLHTTTEKPRRDVDVLKHIPIGVSIRVRRRPEANVPLAVPILPTDDRPLRLGFVLGHWMRSWWTTNPSQVMNR